MAVPEVRGKLCLGERPAIDTNPLSHLQQVRRTIRVLEREGGREGGRERIMNECVCVCDCV